MNDLELLALATWRLSYMITRENGPSAIFAKIRADLGEPKDGELSELFTCQYCASVWVALVVLLCWRLGWFKEIIETLAISARSIQDASYTGVLDR
jgi:hypothetical protein